MVNNLPVGCIPTTITDRTTEANFIISKGSLKTLFPIVATLDYGPAALIVEDALGPFWLEPLGGLESRLEG